MSASVSPVSLWDSSAEETADYAPLEGDATVEVAIIGGGIIGTSIALELADRGVSVALCEKGGIGHEQSSRNWGWVRAGEFVPFDSPLCLLRDLEGLAAEGEDPPSRLYFAAQDDPALRSTATVSFLLTKHVRTTMDAGVLCFASRDAAEAARTRSAAVCDAPPFGALRPC